MIDYQRLYHTGIRVPNLQRAMDEIGASLGVTWAEPVKHPGQGVWTPEGGQQEVPLQFVYSCEGPQHLELLEGPPGSVWDGTEHPGVHHLGVWTDDVDAETQRLIGLGWSVVAAGASPEEGHGGFSYVAPPSGALIELVSSALQPRFEKWWAGGSLFG